MLRNDTYKNFVHCPKKGCDTPLMGNWSNYATGEKNEKGMPLYKCPNCGHEFTADDVKVNAVNVTSNKGMAVIFNIVEKKPVMIFSQEDKFTDGIGWYVHVPLIICMDKNNKLYHLDTEDELTEVEIIEFLTKHIQKSKN